MISSLLASISSTAKMTLEKAWISGKAEENSWNETLFRTREEWGGMFQVKDCENLNTKFQTIMYVYIAYFLTECISKS